MERKTIIDAVTALNQSELAEFKIKVIAVKLEELIENFMRAVETVKEEDESKLSPLIVETYNQIAADQAKMLAEQETKKVETQNVKQNQLQDSEGGVATIVKEKKTYVRNEAGTESRPAMLKRKIAEIGVENVTLELLCQDQELLDKCLGNKSWIKILFNKFMGNA